MKQYEIWWCALPLPIGKRPVLLLSRTPAMRYLSRITVAEITTHIRSIPQEVPLSSRDGLRQKSVANFDNLQTIAKERLTEPIGRLRVGRENEVRRALGYAWNWVELVEN